MHRYISVEAMVVRCDKIIFKYNHILPAVPHRQKPNLWVTSQKHAEIWALTVVASRKKPNPEIPAAASSARYSA